MCIWGLELAPVLPKFFSSRMFADSWKNETVQTIPMKGSKKQPSTIGFQEAGMDYRPIALMSANGKVLKKIVNSVILRYPEPTINSTINNMVQAGSDLLTLHITNIHISNIALFNLMANYISLQRMLLKPLTRCAMQLF